MASSRYSGEDREMDERKEEGPAVETDREVDLASDKQAGGHSVRE